MSTESSPSTIGRRAIGVERLRPSSPGFALPISIAPHLSLWRLIAEGSSLVYEGFDRRMAARVAVKVLATRDDLNAQARLLREAALYANLDHPAVPKFYDVATLADGTPYVVMEFVAGQTLAERLARGALSPTAACDITNQILVSLGVLHRAGIVHRDVKPANIILEPGDEGSRRARLVDLGVAKASAFNSAPDKLTQPGALLGTPQYMAPEQFAGAEADARSDLYAVGLILVEMLTGACPHAARSFADLVAARMRDELDEEALARAGVGEGLTRFLRSALARDPQARFASAEDMQCELYAARADESCLWMQRPRGPETAQEPVVAIATLPPAPMSVASQLTHEGAVWGVLPDPPAHHEVARRPPARSGMRALLLGFGLTFGVGSILVLRAQTRDSIAAQASAQPASSAPAAPATTGQVMAEPSPSPVNAPIPAIPSSLGPSEAQNASATTSVGARTDVRSSADDLSVELSRAAAPRPKTRGSRPRAERPRAAIVKPAKPEVARGEPHGASPLPENPY